MKIGLEIHLEKKLYLKKQFRIEQRTQILFSLSVINFVKNVQELL